MPWCSQRGLLKEKGTSFCSRLLWKKTVRWSSSESAVSSSRVCSHSAGSGSQQGPSQCFAGKCRSKLSSYAGQVLLIQMSAAGTCYKPPSWMDFSHSRRRANQQIQLRWQYKSARGKDGGWKTGADSNNSRKIWIYHCQRISSTFLHIMANVIWGSIRHFCQKEHDMRLFHLFLWILVHMNWQKWPIRCLLTVLNLLHGEPGRFQTSKCVIFWKTLWGTHYKCRAESHFLSSWSFTS